MSRRENHHILPKEFQKKYSIKYPHNEGVYDETTVSIDEEFHDDITSQLRHRGEYRDLPTGVPVAYTIGEIERYLMEEAWGDDD